MTELSVTEATDGTIHVGASNILPPAPDKPRLRGLTGVGTKNPQLVAYVQQTVRVNGKRVGRNAPCPCNSGKKFKQCCLRPPVRVELRSKDPPAAVSVYERLAPYRDVFLQMLPVFPPETLYAYLVTGRVISESSRATCDPAELAAYDEALARWHEKSPEDQAVQRDSWRKFVDEPQYFPGLLTAGAPAKPVRIVPLSKTEYEIESDAYRPAD